MASEFKPRNGRTQGRRVGGPGCNQEGSENLEGWEGGRLDLER